MKRTKIEFKIEGRQYRIQADEFSWHLARRSEGKKKSWLVVGYYTGLEGVAVEVFEEGLLESGATSFAELLQVGKDLRAEVRSAFALWSTDQ